MDIVPLIILKRYFYRGQLKEMSEILLALLF